MPVLSLKEPTCPGRGFRRAAEKSVRRDAKPGTRAP